MLHLYFINREEYRMLLREPVKTKLQKLKDDGVNIKVDRVRWASLIVAVPKSDKSVRNFGNYKVSIKPSVEDEQTTLPTTQD